MVFQPHYKWRKTFFTSFEIVQTGITTKDKIQLVDLQLEKRKHFWDGIGFIFYLG